MKVFLGKLCMPGLGQSFVKSGVRWERTDQTLAQVQANADPCAENAVSCVSAVHAQMRS